MNIDKFLKEINLDNIYRDRWIDTKLLDQFNIEDYSICQDENNIKLTYCYHTTWICTDSLVGIRVWYFDENPVCISFKPYRKSEETFNWLSKDNYNTVRSYLHDLIDNEEDNATTIITEKVLGGIVNTANRIQL